MDQSGRFLNGKSRLDSVREHPFGLSRFSSQSDGEVAEVGTRQEVSSDGICLTHIILTNLRCARVYVEKWTVRPANSREGLKLRQDTSAKNFRIALDKQVLNNASLPG